MKKKKPNLFTLIILISFASIQAVLFTPGLPIMAKYFSVSEHTVDLTVTLFLIGYAIGQLIYGPLGNKFGRKGGLYIGCTIALIGGVISIISFAFTNFALLIIGRLIVALGASCGLTTTFTMINEAFSKVDARKLSAYVLMSFAIVPGLAVAIGGVVIYYFGVLASFYLLTAYCIFVMILVKFLPETITNSDRKSFHPKVVLRGYFLAFKSRRIVLFGTLIGLTTALIYSYVSMAPLIGITGLGLRVDIFGYFNLLPSVFYLASTFITAKLNKRYSSKCITGLGVFIFLCGIALVSIFFFGGFRNPWGFFLSIAVCYFGTVQIFSNSATNALHDYHDKSNGSAVMSFTNMIYPAAAVLILSVIHTSIFTSFAVMALALGLLELGVFIVLRQKIKS